MEKHINFEEAIQTVEDLYFSNLKVVGKTQTNPNFTLVKKKPSRGKRTRSRIGIARKGQGIMTELEKKTLKRTHKNEN